MTPLILSTVAAPLAVQNVLPVIQTTGILPGLFYFGLFFLFFCCYTVHKRLQKIETWITDNEPWLIDHHARHVLLETAICAIETHVYDGDDPSPLNRFCPNGGDPPDGHGGSAPPDGF